MKNLRALSVATAVVLLLSTVGAQEAASSDPEGLAHSFTGAGEYVPVDVDALEELLEAALPPTESVFTASGQLDPLVRALRSVLAFEGEAERARYLLNVQLVSVSAPPAADPVPILLVEVHRFNLAEAIHAELSATLPEGTVADLAEFNPGPHLSWRFAMRQLMGMNSATVSAGRLEFDTATASWFDCLGADCLQTSSVLDELATWDWHMPPQDRSESDLLDPAALLGLTNELSIFDAFAHEAGYRRPEEPVLIAQVVIETGLGQEVSTHAALRIGALLDDSLKADWKRVDALSTGTGVTLYQAIAHECHRGVSDTGLCL